MAKVTRASGGDRFKFGSKFVLGARKGMAAWADLVRQRAMLNAPVASTELAKSIGVSEVESAGWQILTVRIGTNIEYGPAQELGSGLYSDLPMKIEIEAGGLKSPPTSTKMALSFEWPGGDTSHPAYQTEGPYAGKFVFRRVMHPGVPAQPYLRPALLETEMEGRRLLFNAIAAEVTRPGAVFGVKKVYL